MFLFFQGSSNLVLEVHFLVEFKFNPNQAHQSKQIKFFSFTRELLQAGDVDQG